MQENSHNKEGVRHSHVMFVENATGYDKPLFYTSLADASTEADVIIKKEPKATCGIYQLRADLRGEITIIRQDFNKQSS